MTVVVDAAEGLVHLDELAVGQALDVPGLDAVLQDLAVGALEAQAQAVGHEVHEQQRTGTRKPSRTGVDRDAKV